MSTVINPVCVPADYLPAKGPDVVAYPLVWVVQRRLMVASPAHGGGLPAGAELPQVEESSEV